jgi:hypothetical protein
MILAPTQVTINGKRIWLEFDQPDSIDTVVSHMDYRTGIGSPPLLQVNPKLPKRERIAVNG